MSVTGEMLEEAGQRAECYRSALVRAGNALMAAMADLQGAPQQAARVALDDVTSILLAEDGQHGSLSIEFIVNGEPVKIQAFVAQPLQAAVLRALIETDNAGSRNSRGINEWEIRDESRNLLPENRKVGDFQFAAGVRIYISLRVGAGG